MKEWIRVRHTAAGKTSVTVSLVDGNLSSSYSTPSFWGELDKGVKEARAKAHQGLERIRTAVS